MSFLIARQSVRPAWFRVGIWHKLHALVLYKIRNGNTCPLMDAFIKTDFQEHQRKHSDCVASGDVTFNLRMLAPLIYAEQMEVKCTWTGVLIIQTFI